MINRFCCPPAQILAGDVVGAEVLAGENTAHSRFLRRCGEAGEVARDTCQRFGSDVKGEAVAEVKAQHSRARFADCAVRSWVGRIGSRLDAQRRPGCVRVGQRISVRIRQLYGTYRTPEVVRILGVEERDRRVGKAYVQQCEQPRAMLQIEMMRKRGSLRNLVPEVLDVPVPERPYLSLVRSAGGAVNDSQVFDFIEYFRIGGAGEGRRRTGTKLVGPLQRKGSDLKSAGAKFGGVSW